MKKVLLISPSLQANIQESPKNNSYSMGLAYLHSIIEKAGYLIETKNYNNLDSSLAEKEISTKIKDFNPDFLLIQVFTMNRVASYNLIRIVRQFNPNMKIVLGGVHASIYYEQLLKNFDINCVVIGEGEVTIVEVLKSFSNETEISEIKGIAYKTNGKVIKNPDRPLIENIDNIPFPKHELFIDSERTMACMLTSRGCPFKCSFCCLHTISRRKFRTRTVKNVVDEIEYIEKKFKNIKTIQLADDTFTLNLQRAIDICKEIIKRKIKLKFLCSARIKPATPELFEYMEKAGFTHIGFGLETGSPKLLKSIHKSLTQEDVIETFNMLKNSKINLITFLMVGFPGETDETVAETIALTKRLQEIRYFEFAGVARLWVYPNTEVYEYMRDKGKINDDFWLTEEDVPFFTVEHSAEKLEEMVTRIALSCTPKKQIFKSMVSEILHPSVFIKKILPRIKKIKKHVLRKF